MPFVVIFDPFFAKKCLLTNLSRIYPCFGSRVDSRAHRRATVATREGRDWGTSLAEEGYVSEIAQSEEGEDERTGYAGKKIAIYKLRRITFTTC